MKIQEALYENNYPKLLIKQILRKTLNTYFLPKKERQPTTPKKLVVIPFIPGISEFLKRKMSKFQVTVRFKPISSLRKRLVRIKDKVQIEEKSNVVYRIPCANCPKAYIGETTRRLEIRQKEHKSAVKNGQTKNSSIAEHALNNGHIPDWENTKVLETSSKFLQRRIMEAIHIQREPDPLNRDKGVMLPPQYQPIVCARLRRQNHFNNTSNVLTILPTYLRTTTPSQNS